MSTRSLLRHIVIVVVLVWLILTPTIGAAGRQLTQSSVTITFWSALYDPLGRSLLLPYIHQFEKSHPGITVNFVGVDQSNNWVKYTTAMATGHGPDMVLAAGYNPPIPEWAANGLIQPLDAWLTQLHVPRSQWFPWVWKMMYFHGHVWDFMQEYDTTFFVWNKDVFQKAGLDPNRPPQTIAELDADAQKLTTFDAKGNLVRAGFVPWYFPTGGQLDPRYWPEMFGGSVYDQAHARYTINTPANLASLEWLAKYAKMLGGLEKLNGFLGKFTGNSDPFYTGQAAMEVVGDWVPIFTFKPYAPKSLHYGIAAIPAGPGVPYGTNYMLGGDAFALPVHAQHPKEAAELMVYLMRPEPVLAWCIGEANVPPTIAAAFDPRFVKGVPFMDSVVRTAHLALKDPAILKPAPSSGIYDYVSSQYLTAVQEVEFGRKSAQAALAEVQALADQREATVKRDNPQWYGGGD
jgi:ABC-type glycerol-3-phosphate transport system substrate-binding protein